MILQQIISSITLPHQLFSEFAASTGRRLHLEIEPGTYLVARAGSLLCRIQVCVICVLSFMSLTISCRILLIRETRDTHL